MNDALQNLSDEELCALAAAGDDCAMAELINRIMPLAGAKAAMYKHAELNTEDLLQEGMLGFITAVNTYDPQKNASFKTYAGVCINNRIVSSLRRHDSARNIPRNLMSPISEDESEMQDYSSDPQEIFFQQEETVRLQGLIDEQLSELERAVVMLRVQGMSYDDIADSLSVSAKAVDNALMRARRKLSDK